MTLCVVTMGLGVRVNNMYTTSTTLNYPVVAVTTYTTQWPLESTDRPSTPVEVYRYKTKEDDYLPALLAAL